jgi:monofunctional biosynthetic peptidoglycan transglycosylase
VKQAFLWLVSGLLALLGLTAICALVALARVAPIDVRALARRAPARSALMEQREREARQRDRPYAESRHWVSLDRMSPHLRNAVLVAEDARFFSHEGFDWNEIRQSASRNLRERRIARGGSTITQQLAKNLWLSTAQTPWRKFEEMILAVRLERSLGKRRILELYLNTIEWGDGIYGAEAAARHWFGVSAASLGAGQAIRLAAVIINPRRYSPIEPSPRIENRVRIIAGRLRRRGAITEAEYRVAVGLPPEAPAPAVDSTFLPPPPDSGVVAEPEIAPAPGPGLPVDPAPPFPEPGLEPPATDSLGDPGRLVTSPLPRPSPRPAGAR